MEPVLPPNSEIEVRPSLPFVRKWGILAVLSLALAIIILDTTILNVALSTIIQDLGTTIQSLQWVITAYSLTLAALTITGGRMGDIFGRKRMFVLGAFLFAVGSFLASVSTSVTTLIIGESIIEGIGAALMMPATASLLVSNFRGHERAIAFGIWGGIAGASVALGPVLGGFLATNYSWRWGFRVNLIVVGLLILGSVLIPHDKKNGSRPELDWLGVILSATGLLSFVFGIIESSRYGWFKAQEVFTAFGHEVSLPWNMSVVPVFMLVGALILAIFMVWESKREAAGHSPLVSLHLFENRMFTSGIFTTAIMSLGQTGLIFALPVFLQSVRGLDAFHTGLALLPMSLGLLVISPLSAMVSRKIDPKYLISLGLFLNALAYVALWYSLSVDTTSGDLVPGLLLYGIGMGFVMSQINNITLSAVEVHEAGEASGINNTLRQVGSTFGSAIMGAILIGALGTQLVQGVDASQVIPENLKPELARVVETQTSNVEFGGGAQLDNNLPEELKAEIIAIGHEATVQASKRTLAFGGAFAFLGFIVAMIFLPKRKHDKPAEPEKSVAMSGGDQEPEPLTTALIGELIAADHARVAAGEPGLGSEVRTVINLAQAGTSILDTLDPRFVQAQLLWKAGFATELGLTSFTSYLKTLPEVPPSLLAKDFNFPYLVLVEARVSPLTAARLLNVEFKQDPTAPAQAGLQITGQAYWMRVQAGNRFQGLSVDQASAQFAPQERGLSLVEGLALLVQYPEIVEAHYLDLPASAYEGRENTAACLGRWGNQLQIRWRWRAQAHESCVSASGRVE